MSAPSIKFFLRHGAVVDWPIPDPQNFSFQVMVLNIRATGFFSSPEIYIPHDEIAAIGMSSGPVKITQPGQVREHPTRQ